jgi:hypothetical protein
MKENRGLQTSLTCLQHPLSLLCIGMLLLNDHVLKVAFPYWLTGKLSDFAGLFFFPFIVAAGISLLLSSFKIDAGRIGYLSFGIVAAWFTALKTASAVNSITAWLAGTLLERPIAYALDATDLIALLVLLPAWFLWNKLQTAQPRRLAYAALCIGAIAAMATSPAAPPTVIESFAYQDGSVYANDFGRILVSRDFGINWDYCGSPCLGVRPPEQPPKLPVVVCDPDSPKTCYRITGNPNVEGSSDGGKTWSIAWQISPARVDYLRRSGTLPTPMDLIIVPAPGKALLVAMGVNGVLQRSLPNGKWKEIVVSDAKPASLVSSNIFDALGSVARELGTCLGISLLLALSLGLLCWIAAAHDKQGLPESQTSFLLICISVPAASTLLATIVWPLWALGVIWDYNTAWILTGSAAGTMLAAGVWLIRREIVRAEKQ